MNLKNDEFLGSFTEFKKIPILKLPEYAFTGRSNVGKSTLINLLVNQKIAKVSQTPGKTQMLNLFLINHKFLLVDLPGYGYARTSKSNRHSWSVLTEEYLLQSQFLHCVFVLLDSRLSPQKNDMIFMEWLSNNKIPFVMVFTKCDKLNQNQKKVKTADYNKQMLENWESLPKQFFTDSIQKNGVEEIQNYIKKLNNSTSGI